jgi:hypothetical protein
MCLLAAGCKSHNDEVAQKLEVPAEALTIAAEKQMTTAKMTMQEQVAWSIRDLAQRRGVAAESITVSNARPVTWRSGAIGCPQPGMNYTEALVPGVSILLKTGDEMVVYHAVVGGEPLLCPWGRAETPVYGEDSDQI